MANKMLIDATHPEETRVVVLRGNRVEEFDFETAHRKQLRGNIYLAKVTRVEPSLQAAFVDYGGNRHGFLAFSEIHPDYYQIPVADRQALIEADARDAREFDDDDHRGRRRHDRGRRHERPASRRDESVQSEPVAIDRTTGESTEAPPHEHESAFQHEPAQPPTEHPAEPGPYASSASDMEVPIEAAPMVEAETASAEPSTESAATEEPAASPDAAAEPPSAEPSALIEDAAAPAPEGNGQNGHATGEDEEEVVESVGGSDALEEVAERAPRFRRQYKIQEVIKRRQVMLVQVVKEERGTKGAALTTYLSLAGRYCVLMPNTARGGGISRKITSPEDRKKLREIAEELEVPEGMGVILRTAGAARTKAEVRRDFEYLLRLWEQVRDLTLKSTAPTLVYEEGSLAKRSIRDLYTKDIDEVIVAGESGYQDAKEFMRMLMPSHAKNVKLYKDTQPVFTRYGIESQLDAMFSPTVQLRSGGYIVLNQTEALVSIDVNSGRSTREHHIEDTALKTNVEAAEEIARQLRLRDLAGLIVIDFIDMDEKRNNRTVERRLKDALRHDRARIQVGRISHFGLLEMSRQRIRTSVLESSTEKCAHCGGTGHVRSVSSVSLQLLRSIEETLLKGPTHNLIVRTRPEIALYVLNHKRAHLHALEERFRISITIKADADVGGQTGFVIDRGEQVMSIEQARSLVAQSEAPPVLIEEEEPETLEIADESEAERDEAAEQEAEAPDLMQGQPSLEAGVPHDESGHDDNGREGGRGRRRRRRRGRGRGGEERSGQSQQAERRPADQGDSPHQATAFASPGDADFAADEAMPAGEQAHPSSDEGEHHGGNGRRRRRGRRGGRRNRRDRDDHAFADSNGAAGHEEREQFLNPAEHQAVAADHSAPMPVPNAESQPMETVHPPPSVGVARMEQLSPATDSSSPQAHAEAPRRRSTVREPAPIFGEPPPATMVAPSPSSPAPVVVTTTAGEHSDADKPRRTGWWAKRLLGGDKS